MAKVFIGMPVYNGARFMRQALESIHAQSFTDWKLLIGDNGSTDETPQICREYALQDKRVAYVRRPGNLGPSANYIKLLEVADAPFFMWAACDDLWRSDFLRACVDKLERHVEFGLASTGLVNVDSYGAVIREYPDFHKLSGRRGVATIVRFLNSPEVMGKANLFYALYRLEVCRRSLHRSPMPEILGADMCFVLAALSIGGVIIDSRPLFCKRIARAEDLPNNPRKIEISDLVGRTFPGKRHREYVAGLLHAVRYTRFWLPTLCVMTKRALQLLLSIMIRRIRSNRA